MSKRVVKDWATGIEMAATAMGVGADILYAARKHPAIIASKAFKGNGKVDLTTLRTVLPAYMDELRSLVANQEDDNWVKVKQKYDALMAQKKYEEMEEKYILRETVEKEIEGLAQAQKALLRTKFLTELPSQLTGLTTPEISIKLECLLNDICEMLTNLKIKNE